MRKKHVNRKYKDRLFRLVFSEKKDLLELYNAVSGSSYENPDELEITTLDDAVYMGMKNDVSFIIGDVLNLYEHQSSYNPNMPIRGLLYLADVYRKLIDSRELNLYGSSLVSLPYPKYLVFYNGNTEKPDRVELRLSDAFKHEEEHDLSLEFIAVMLNINIGHNKELLEHCKRLRDYSLFVGEVKKLLREGYLLRQAIDTAIENCIRQNILADILSAHRSEVRDMCLYDYDFEKHMELERKQWKEVGVKEGIEQERIQSIKTLITTLRALNHSYEETKTAILSQYQLSEEKSVELMKQYWLF